MAHNRDSKQTVKSDLFSYNSIRQLLPVLFVLTVSLPCGLAQPPILDVATTTKSIQGLPIHWGKHDGAILESNGNICVFDQADVISHRVLNSPFVPKNLATVKVELQAELGNRFETIVSGPYVIAAPSGSTKQWQDRFNALMAGYMRYFEVRGWPLRSPDFPLVVVVFPNRSTFVDYSMRESGMQANVASNVVGSYFPYTNRCLLFDQTTSGLSSETEATIVHEAVHQLAHNSGVHERLFQNPMWFVEGLACMFEQREVYDLRIASSTIETRMRQNYVQQLQALLQDSVSLEQALTSLIASDDYFRVDVQQAYAVSWAMTFYFAERQPEQLRTFYGLLSQRGLGEYTVGDRVADFRQAFGIDSTLLSVQLQRLFAPHR